MSATARKSAKAPTDEKGAAKASAPPPDAAACEDEGTCPVPITAWTTDEEGRDLALGLNPNASPAEWAFARLSRLIEDLEKNIDAEDEVAANMVGAPGGGALRIEDLGYWAPDLVMFYCRTDDGRPIRIIQHYTQVSVALAVKRKPTSAPQARRIGFQLRERLERAAAEGADAPTSQMGEKAPPPFKEPDL